MIRQKQVKNITFATLAALTASTLTTPEFAFITAENAFYTKIAGVNTKISDTDVMTLTTAQTVTGVKTFTTQPVGITAASIVNVAAGTIAAVTVQAALNELDTEKQSISEKSAINGYASLDGTGKVPAAELPSYVDDVLEYVNLAGFPGAGTTGIIYVDLATNKVYRWTGATYVEVSAFSGVATDISVVPAGNITVTNVGAALNQLDGLMVHLAGAETITGIKTFTAQPVGITGASIVNVAAGNIAAVTTQAAINELDTEKQKNIQFQEESVAIGTSGIIDTINFLGGGTASVAGTVLTYDLSAVPATSIANTPAGTIAATTVQAALNELDTEKQVKMTIAEEGTSLAAAGVVTGINFIGTGVTAALVGTVANVTIATGGTENFVVLTPTGTNAIPNLTILPLNAALVKIYINGLLETSGISVSAGGVFTIVAGTLGYNVETTDLVQVNYFS